MIPTTDQSRPIFRSQGLPALASALLGVALSGGGASVRAFTPADADAIFAAHAQAFYRVENGRAWFLETTEGGKVSYWMRAEQMEMVLDAYERTKKPELMTMFTDLFHGFIADHGRNWAHNPFNDDVMWMVIACVRAHQLGGNREFLDVAKLNFDLCYDRAASPELGGGLWWKVDKRSKNACVNGPGAIAAYLLGQATHEHGYFTIARSLYAWERANLFDPATGRVADNLSVNGRGNRRPWTYNQGTFIGAAHLLGYHDDARLAASFTMTRLCPEGYLPAYGENGDTGGFNGIAARWIARFMNDLGEQATFEPWLQKNAEAAWHARRSPDNLSWCRWPQSTPPDARHSWGCSSAVVLLQVVRPTEPKAEGTR